MDFGRTMPSEEHPKITITVDNLVEEQRSMPQPSPVSDRLGAFSNLGLNSPCASNQIMSPTRTEATSGRQRSASSCEPSTERGSGNLKRRLFVPISSKDTNQTLDPNRGNKRLSKGISCEDMSSLSAQIKESAPLCSQAATLRSSCSLLDMRSFTNSEEEDKENNDGVDIIPPTDVQLLPPRLNVVRSRSTTTVGRMRVSSPNRTNRKSRALTIRNTTMQSSPLLERKADSYNDLLSPNTANVFELRQSSPADLRHSTNSLSRSTNTPRSSQTVFNMLLETDPAHNFLIIDCRFEYEFSAGHIRDAVNVSTYETLENIFLQPIIQDSKRTIIIFHCEFSSKRGPNMCKYLRKRDRELHLDCYPELYYPEIYVMEGGYKKFFEEFKQVCEPMCYLPMDHHDYKKECLDGMKLARMGDCRPNPKRSVSCSNIHISPPTDNKSFRPALKDLSNISATPTQKTRLSTGLSASCANFPFIRTKKVNDVDVMKIDIPDDLSRDSLLLEKE
ncbi:M-phase inducer phosphatase 1 isoform 1 [Planoprotostelium fungivorum]|uniref:M-phase inducer phosphatase n=1 Tax=Planoprotostelium fungivorum TaxID=1890364 RepID=A0A2P6N5S6_9EUKA|nr:M-phase inducer phosphatase 1 isoform 1 [Planoprotostelium fungivorum]